MSHPLPGSTVPKSKTEKDPPVPESLTWYLGTPDTPDHGTRNDRAKNRKSKKKFRDQPGLERSSLGEFQIYSGTELSSAAGCSWVGDAGCGDCMARLARGSLGYVPTYVVFWCAVGGRMDDFGRVEDGV